MAVRTARRTARRTAGRTDKLGIEPATAQLEQGLGLSLVIKFMSVDDIYLCGKLIVEIVVLIEQ